MLSHNCTVLFNLHRAPDPELIQWPKTYNAADFNNALICHLTDIAKENPTVLDSSLLDEDVITLCLLRLMSCMYGC